METSKYLYFIVAIIVFSQTTMAFKSENENCLSALFRAGTPVLKDYKWGVEENSIIGKSTEGHTELINENGTFFVEGALCRVGNPERTFEEFIYQAGVNAKYTIRKSQPDVWKNITAVCKNAEVKSSEAS